jgi:uncharacterized damage-inducible protein DinB
MDEMRTVYGWVVETRAGLLSFLEGLLFDVVARELDDVGHGSMRGLLLHVAGCYRWWLHAYVNELPMPKRDDKSYPDMRSIRKAFSEVDAIADTFCDSWAGSSDATLSRRVPWGEKPLVVTPRWLFTHATTHEFHHKGQIVMLCRRLGHPPAETDLVVPKSFG